MEGVRPQDPEELLVSGVRRDGDAVWFEGDIDEEADLRAAADIARECSAYAVDDDEECYLEGARTCFDCRYRRWRPGGFTCMKGLLPG